MVARSGVGSPLRSKALARRRIRSGLRGAAVRQLAMGGFEIGQIDEVSIAPDRSLHRDEVRKRADRCVDSVDSPSLCPRQEVGEGQCGSGLRNEVQVAVRRREMDRPVPGESTLRYRRAVGSSRLPPVGKRPDPIDVVCGRVEHRVDISRRSYHAVTNQRDSSDQHVTDASTVEAVEDAAEVGQ